ncbi:hypothetical protein L914_03146 [Phytophthora nicotianae]|uniref:Myb/SANT-like domain-containing protein n=1 Tax=Phytophthora nicotianae TaxID=4792 RepID=W2NXA2_PHYNI|nr:hypothetical protein L914_03146 [Phytophthora nicotianae]
MGKTTKSSKKQTKSTKKPAHTSRSSTTPTTASQQRATTKGCFPTTDKGLKTKAWRTLTDALNAKHKRSLDKGQYKAKKDRITRDYDFFKEIKELSGVGVCPTTGKLTFPDDVWKKLIATKPLKQQHSNSLLNAATSIRKWSRNKRRLFDACIASKKRSPSDAGSPRRLTVFSCSILRLER